MPTITATTIQAIQDASAEKKKHLTYSEAGKLPSMIESQALPWSGLVFFALVAGLTHWICAGIGGMC